MPAGEKWANVLGAECRWPATGKGGGPEQVVREGLCREGRRPGGVPEGFRKGPGGVPEESRRGPGRVPEGSRGGPGVFREGQEKSEGVLGASRGVFTSLLRQLGADLGANLGALGGRLGAISAFLEGAIFEVAFHTPPGPIWEAIWVPEKVHFEAPKGLETRSGAPVHFYQKCIKT